MTLHVLRDRPSPEFSRALADFESRFTYPLGPGRSFSISHGEDYPRFYRSMGDANCFVIEKGKRIVGTLSVAIRPIITPEGGQQQAAYTGDLKVDPSARGSLVFLRLAQAAVAWAKPQVSAAYGVVMDGTRASPSEYTGRIGIPAFSLLGHIDVLRFSTAGAAESRCEIAPLLQGEQCYRALSRGRYFAMGGHSTERSEVDPAWIVHRNGLACGRLEDTRRAKRLIDSDGVEMQSAHLACFAWKDARAGVEIIHAARDRAEKLGLPALFVAVPRKDMEGLKDALGPIDCVIAPATIYGAGLPNGADWNINSSEI